MKIHPSFEEFRSLSAKGNLIPLSLDLIADMETPVSAYHKMCGGQAHSAYSFLLESVEGGENIGRYSILGTNPRAVFIQEKGQGRLVSGSKSEEIPGRDVFERVAAVMSRFKAVSYPGLPPFIGGAVGYSSYDIISEIEPSVKAPASTPIEVPEALFMITDSLLVFDRVKHTIKVISFAFIEGNSPADLEAAYKSASSKILSLAERLRNPVSIPPVDLEMPPGNPNYESNKTRAEFRQMVSKAKEYILNGDIIQTVLSQRFKVPCPQSPLAVYRSLRMVNPSPYMFLLDCGNFALVGASPEVHAKCEEGQITVRPIAGTMKRGQTPEEDLALEKKLLADPKECAEHIMLVDLGRNDVGRIAELGSVKVDELMIVERYSHVMHIVSNVTGTLAKDHGADAVMRATFPAGTLSGAPKIRAMQIISELENEKRGPYGGAVAYYSFNGNVNSCITIRTAVLKDGYAHVQSGAGIVADSDPDTEFEETCSKAKAMMRALALAEHFSME